MLMLVNPHWLCHASEVHLRGMHVSLAHVTLASCREMSWYLSLLPTLLLSCTDEAQSIIGSSPEWLSDVAKAFPPSQQVTRAVEVESIWIYGRASSLNSCHKHDLPCHTFLSKHLLHGTGS